MRTYLPSTEPERPQRQDLTPAKVAAAMRTFFRIADAWGLTAEESGVLLGRPSRATLFKWKAGDVRRLAYDTLRRVSYVLGIWKALQILFPAPTQADAWVRKPNALLGGQTALQRMLAGDVTDLAAVRALLDAARGDGA
jgi:hypothetical protein